MDFHSARISLEDDDTTSEQCPPPRFTIELIDTEYHLDEVEGVVKGERMRHYYIQRDTHYT